MGDSVEIYTFTQVGGLIQLDSQGLGSITFQYCNLGTSGNSASVDVFTGFPNFTQCITNGLTIYTGTPYGYTTVTGGLTYDLLCSGGSVNLLNTSHVTVFNGVVMQLWGVDANIECQGTIICQAGGIQLGQDGSAGGTIWNTDGVTAFVIVDYITVPVTIFPGGRIISEAPFFANNNVGTVPTTYRIYGGSNFFYSSGNPPTVYGALATTFAIIGGNTKSSGQIPFFDVNSGACIAVYQ